MRYSHIKIKPKIQENQDPPQPKLQTTHCDDIKKILSIFKSEEKTAHLPNNISTKIKNNNSKCGTASILPNQRTACVGRCTISYKEVMENNLNDVTKLSTCTNGIVVLLQNEDYFDLKEKTDDFSKYLIVNIGGDQVVSSIISIGSTGGDSGSSYASECFARLQPEIEKNNWFPAKRNPDYKKKDTNDFITLGNNKWHGQYYVDISGGSQENKKIKSGIESQLFNCFHDYANEEVATQIDAKMIYYMCHSNGIEKYIPRPLLDECINKLEIYLKGIQYDDGCLYGSHVMRKCLKIKKDGKKVLICPLTDQELSIDDFAIGKDDDDPNVMQICHEEAVYYKKLYYDKTRGYIITARRPQNLFWGKKLGNMQQQHFTIDEYWAYMKKKVNEHDYELDEHDWE